MISVGAVLRLYGLGDESLWNDELSSWARSQAETLAAVAGRAAGDVHPPGYTFLLYFTQRYVGESEAALRLPSALAGIAAIWALAALGTRLYGAREGLVAAGLLAFGWTPIWYSQEARPYALLLLFSIVSTHCWVALLDHARSGQPPSLAARVAYVLAAIVTAYLHYFGLLLVGLHALGAIARLRQPRALARVALVYAVVAAAYLPWAASLLGAYARDHTWIDRPTAEAAARYWSFLFREPHVLGAVAAALCAAWGVQALREHLRGARGESADFHATPWLAAWLVVPFAIAFLQSVVSTPVLTSRNLIISLPAAYLLVARAVTALSRGSRLWPALPLVLVGLTASGLLTHRYYSEPQKQDFRGAAHWLAEREPRYPDSVIVAFAFNVRYFDYYLERTGADGRVALLAGKTSDIDKVDALLARRSPRHLWHLAGHRIPEPGFLDHLRAVCRAVEEHQAKGVAARLFECR